MPPRPRLRTIWLLAVLPAACEGTADTGESCLAEALSVLDECGADCSSEKEVCDAACASEECATACEEEMETCSDGCEVTYGEATRTCS